MSEQKTSARPQSVRIAAVACLVIAISLPGCKPTTSSDVSEVASTPVFQSNQYSLSTPVWSRDGEFLAFSGFDANSADGKIYTFQVSTSTLAELYHAPLITLQDWSPSGEEMLIYEEGNIELLELAYPHARKPLTSGVGASWSQLGEWIAVIESKANGIKLKLFEPESGREHLFPEKIGWLNAYAISWSSDDTQLLLSATTVENRNRADIFLIDLRDESVRQLTTAANGQHNFFPQWLQDHQISYLETSVYESNSFVVLLDMLSSCESRIPINSASAFAFSPDRRLGAYILRHNVVGLLKPVDIFDSLPASGCTS